MKLSLSLIALAVLLPGCALTLPADPTKMSADQLREWSKDKSAGVQCVVVNSPWGKGVATSVNVDQKVLKSGSVSVDGDCRITLTSDDTPPVKMPPGTVTTINTPASTTTIVTKP